MKDYERYMNRQKLSETGMTRLVKLEETGRKGVAKRDSAGMTGVAKREAGRRTGVPQWVKYCGMAASLVVVFGVFALAILQGGRGIDPNPIANASATPAAEELIFNEVVSVPFTDEAIAGGMALNPMEIADAALLFGSSEDDFDGFKEDMGWGKFDMEYYCVDMSGDLSGNKDAFRFLLKGDYVSLQEEAWYSNFYPANNIWLEVYEGHSYLSEEAWQVPVVPYNDTQYCKFIPCQINGHKVIAACDGHDCQAAAVFDVEAGGKTYGVLYSVTAYGEHNAKELVTKLVQRVTKDGLFPETYSVGDGAKLHYAEMTEPSVGGMIVLTGETDRPLRREEVEAVYPVAAGADGENYIWYGTAYYKADGNLRLVVIQGDKMDETASVNIVIGETEADVFTRNLIVKDGKRTYFGADNSAFASGLDLLRCFYVNEPGYFNAAANAYHCYAQYQVTGDSKCGQVRTCVEGGSLLENETFHQEWFDRTAKGGLWFHTGTINGKEVWDLPGTDKVVELLGPYYMELDGEETAFCPRMVFYADGSFVCGSDLASSHSCEGTFTVKDGQVVANCERHRFVFDIIDENNLRYVGEKSDEMVRYITPKVTDGAMFRRTLDDEGNIVTRDGDTYYVTYSQDGKTPSYDSSKPFTYKFGEEISWKDLPVGEVEPAWNQADKEPVELNGVYYMEADNGDALGNAAKVTIEGGAVTIASERLNYHTCTSKSFARETENGTPLLRVVCDKCKGIYSFEIVDAETLRFDMDHSAVEGHHSDWTFEVTHGTTFRHLKDGEQTTTLLVWGETTHHEDEHHSSSHH